MPAPRPNKKPERINMRHYIISISDRLHQLMRRVSVFAVCLMFLTVVVQIIARYVFSSPPVWTEDVARDLPLNFHPAGTGVLWVVTPIGAGGATDIRAELSAGAARVSVAVVRCSANSFGV